MWYSGSITGEADADQEGFCSGQWAIGHDSLQFITKGIFRIL